jgi:ABC-type transport system involved in multi-copper enzyme maturation permease subunit
MRAMMRKDWRTYRAPVIGTVVLAVLPYLYLPMIFLVTRHAIFPPGRREWLGAVAEMSTYSLALLAVIAAAFGGTAWAAERAEGSATFVALLPPTRRTAAISKLVITAAWLASCYALDASVGLTAVTLGGVNTYSSITPTGFLVTAGDLAGYGFLAFSFAWLCSTWLTSSAISTVVGIVAALVVAAVIGGLAMRHTIWGVSSFAIGGFALLVGTGYVLRRVAP